MNKFASLLFLIWGFSASAAYEIVQSFPIETDLAIPGVRDTQATCIELIHSAKERIDIEQFYVQFGDALDPVVEALKEASQNIKIRLLIDSKFYQKYPEDADRLAQLPNVELKTADFSKYGGIMHAKYLVVDGKRAYLGSANFDWRSLSHIHEVGIKTDDAKVVGQLQKIFDRDWGGVETQPSVRSRRTKKTAADIQLLSSPSEDAKQDPGQAKPTLDALLDLMKQSKSLIQIQVYQYGTSIFRSSEKFEDLDQAIRLAATGGKFPKKAKKVQLLVDQVSLNGGYKDLKSLSQIKNVEIRVVQFPEWSGGPIEHARVAHSKYMIIDGKKAWIGSENWQGNYFNSCRNVGAVIEKQEAVHQLSAIYNKLWDSPYVSPLK